MHALWQRYCAAALADGANPVQTLHAGASPALDARLAERVAGLELVGARLSISRAHDARCAGVEGLVVRDAPAALHLLTRAGRLTIVGKAGAEVRLALGNGAVAVLDGRALVRSM